MPTPTKPATITKRKKTLRKTSAVTVRNIPIEVHRALMLRAKQRGRSTEAEIRSILFEAIQPRMTPGDLLVEFGKTYGELPYDPRDRSPVEPAIFE